MTMRRLVAAAALASVAGGHAQAQAQPGPRFAHERPVAVSTPGPQRLDPDAALLAGARPFQVVRRNDRFIAARGLGDLRLFTPDGREVPYLVVAPPSADPAWVAGVVLPIAPTEKTSGVEADFGAVVPIDAVQLGGIRAPYLKRFRLEGSGDRERWTMLVAEGTAFDLPEEGLSQQTIAFEAGAYRYLRITWDDTNSGRVNAPSLFAARRIPRLPPPHPVLRTPLAFERRPGEPGQSRFAIRLPGARLPIVSLELQVGGGHLLRRARVLEAQLTGEQAAPAAIGDATLRRVVRDGIAADALRVPIAPPREAEIELVVDDGNNPPLELQAVMAVFAELPWIYFEADAVTLTARWGDRTLDAPRYDLEAARADIPYSSVARAAWGEARALALREETPAVPMPGTGATLDAASFRYERPIPDGPAGLIAVPLDGK